MQSVPSAWPPEIDQRHACIKAEEGFSRDELQCLEAIVGVGVGNHQHVAAAERIGAADAAAGHFFDAGRNAVTGFEPYLGVADDVDHRDRGTGDQGGEIGEIVESGFRVGAVNIIGPYRGQAFSLVVR